MASKTHVALLRGINVGGRNKLPMKNLVSLFEEAGCRRVRTYIQSGNVIFDAAPTLARKIPRLIAESIERSFQLQVPVITRTAEEIRQIVAGNPFLKTDVDSRALCTLFLADRPAPEAVASLDPERSPPDSFAVLGREIYLCLPQGVARSKLTTSYFDSRLATTSTARNWNTTLKLLSICQSE